MYTGWADREKVENHHPGGQQVPKKVTGSVRKLVGAGNLSDSSSGLGCVSHLCSELGQEVPFRLETAAEWEFPQGAGALTQEDRSGRWGKQKETQLLLKEKFGDQRNYTEEKVPLVFQRKQPPFQLMGEVLE